MSGISHLFEIFRQFLAPVHLRRVPDSLDSSATGIYGEKIVASALRARGYKILVKNYRTPLGEIDIACRHESTLVFVEVKTRSVGAWGRPSEAVGRSKQRKLLRAARAYLDELKVKNVPVRFDVAEILVQPGLPPKIEILRNAFGQS